MIGIEIKERLGNQLFRYAFARKLQLERADADLLFGESFFKGKDASQGWCNGLEDFNVAPHRRSCRKLVYSEGSLEQRLLLLAFYLDIKILRKPRSLAERHERQNAWNRRLQKHGLAVVYDNSYEPAFPDKGNVFLEGSFENTKYFDCIRPRLLEELTPKQAPLPRNAGLYESIAKRNSVCVSVRRGDFLSNRFKDVFDVCTEGYYRRAIDEMRRRVEDPVFIFFSDDIEWVRKHLAGPQDLCESGSDPNWEKLRLMYSCKHFILSNSTFAWWAQYLCRNEGKIVLAPERWFNDDRPQHLLLDSFIKIKV